MKTQISNSLKDNMSSIQLKLNDFGLKDPIKKILKNSLKLKIQDLSTKNMFI